MKKKDPYLEELDELNDLEEGEAPPDEEEPTRVDLPLEPPPVKEKGAAAVQDLMGLAPDIPVQVVVVMGRKGVTVKDLLALKSGQVIDMGKAPAEPVDLVASGRVIAKGELVEVDGKLGVRILKLLK